MKTAKKGQRGVNIVEGLVLADEFKARWQQVDSQNDDGIDGLIFLEDSKENLNGKVIFAQVKRYDKGDIIEKNRSKIKISVGIDQISRRRIAWSRVAGASIIIWVDPNTGFAYWADLMDEASYDGASIIVDLKQRFDYRARRALSRLSGEIGSHMTLPVVICDRADNPFVQLNGAIRTQAKDFYRSIESIEAANKDLGNVMFTGVGWQHITRPGRPKGRILQSFLLLGAARKIVGQVPTYSITRQLTHPEATLYSLRARVIFPHRDAAVVEVNLLQKTASDINIPNPVWFYSVYETRRRRGIMGE